MYLPTYIFICPALLPDDMHKGIMQQVNYLAR